VKQQFENRKFRPDGLALIGKVNEVLARYAAQNYTMTLRQVYYQLVAGDVIPNKTESYDNLGRLVANARRAGLIDWAHMEDRTRNITEYSGYDTTADLVRIMDRYYQQHRWNNQETIIECWVEKEALAGVIEQAAGRYRMPWMACRGYMADIEMYGAAQRLHRRYNRLGQKTLILHFGDHDPSGIDMTRDNADRLAYFGCGSWIVEVKRMALNMEQIEQYNPPPNPAKSTDSRFKQYQNEFGNESWELDALEPTVMAQLIEDEWQETVDHDKWMESLAMEKAGEDQLLELSDRWPDVELLIGTHKMFLPGRKQPGASVYVDWEGSEDADTD
jgi:hypothetical protein